MISLENTETAFKSKSNADLNRAVLLFRFIGNKSLVKIGTPLARLGLKIGGPFRSLIRSTIFRHFCGGENIRDCENTIVRLNNFKVKTILDYSVEGKELEEDFERTCEEILDTQDRAALDSKIPFNVFKLTGIARFGLLEKLSAGQELTEAEKIEFERIQQRLDRLCKKAAEVDRRLMMDAEESWIQPIMDDLALDMMRKMNREKPLIYATFQMYRHDRLELLMKWHQIAVNEGFHLGVKLVRGAYMEKERERAAQMGYPNPIQPNKEATDRDYNLALDFITDNIHRIGLVAGTHNEQSSIYLTSLQAKKNIPANDPNIYYSQLLGMGDHISFNLAEAGYNVAKYVPYGPVDDVLPYLIRRADENTSVAGQSSRELVLLTREKRRRSRRL